MIWASKFTWMRGINTESFRVARLDRALGNVEWKNRYPYATVKHLPMVNSDYSPLLITTEPNLRNKGPKEFRFNMAWSTQKDFLICVRKAWHPDRDLEGNKKEIAIALTKWNKSTFGNVFHRRKRLLARIEGVQRCLAQKSLLQSHQTRQKIEERIRRHSVPRRTYLVPTLKRGLDHFRGSEYTVLPYSDLD